MAIDCGELQTKTLISWILSVGLCCNECRNNRLIHSQGQHSEHIGCLHREITKVNYKFSIFYIISCYLGTLFPSDYSTGHLTAELHLDCLDATSVVSREEEDSGASRIRGRWLERGYCPAESSSAVRLLPSPSLHHAPGLAITFFTLIPSSPIFCFWHMLLCSMPWSSCHVLRPIGPGLLDFVFVCAFISFA